MQGGAAQQTPSFQDMKTFAKGLEGVSEQGYKISRIMLSPSDTYEDYFSYSTYIKKKETQLSKYVMKR